MQPEFDLDAFIGGLIVLTIIGVIFLTIVLNSFVIVQEKTAVVIERFGKFNRVISSGLSFKIPFIEKVKARVNLKVQQADVKVETKTKDNVFVTMDISVQYNVKSDKVYEANYKLDEPESQISNYVFDVVRASVPKLELDAVFEKKDDIADDVKKQLDATMDEYGFDIVKALVTDIDPDQTVKESMNKINAATRLRQAAEQEGEAAKIKVIKAAEAESESKKLQGEGIANQRKAIVNGLKDSVEAFKEGVEGVSAKDVMGLVVITQYFDTLKDIGATNKSSVILTPHSPSGLADIQEQIIQGLTASKRVE